MTVTFLEASGSNIAYTDQLDFTTDSSAADVRVIVSFPSTGVDPEIVFWDGAFTARYSGGSSYVDGGALRTFHINRTGYWPANIALSVAEGTVAGYGLAGVGSTVALKTTPVVLTDAANINIDASVGPNYKLTITGNNHKLKDPTNAAEGQRLQILVTQDGVGGHNLTYDTSWVAVDPSTTIDTTIGNSSWVNAYAVDPGTGIKWFYTVSHANEAEASAGYGITVSGSVVAQKTAPVVLTDAATVAINGSLGPNYKLTLTGNHTLGNPSSLVEGQIYRVMVTMGGAGGYLLSFDTSWIAIDPTGVVDGTLGNSSLVEAIAIDAGSGVKLFYSIRQINKAEATAGYGIDINSASISLKAGVRALADAATVAIDASLGPNFKLTITGNHVLGNPSNSAEGQRLQILVTQDGVGGHTLGVSANWIAVDPSVTIDTTIGNSSWITAYAVDAGSGVKWFYTVTHINETANPTAGYGISVAGSSVAQKTAVTTLTDAATVAIDASLGPNYKLTIGGNRTMGNPSNVVEGQHIQILVTQDATGGRTLAFGASWVAVDPSVTIDTVAHNSSWVSARAFDDGTGSGVRFFFTVTHINETAAPSQGYGISVSGSTVSLATAVNALVDGATVAIDANNGPEYSWTIAGDHQLLNPTNAAAGKHVQILITQDGTGGRILSFDTAWVNEGRIFQIAQAANATSLLRATYRGTSWYFVIEHGEYIEKTATAISTTDQTDWSPLGLAYADLIRGSCSTSSRNLHGIVAPTRGTTRVSFRYVHTGSFNLVLKHDSGTEVTAANRIYTQTAGDLTLQPNDTVDFHYDFTSTHWRIF